MARNKGTFPFAANFEVKAASPLDPRALVERKSELISKDTWPLDGDTLYVYKGLLVSVQEEKAIYMLVDPDKILAEDYSGWERKDGSQGGEGGAASQSDWSTSDESDPAYIRNRTHYVVEHKITEDFTLAEFLYNKCKYDEDTDGYYTTSDIKIRYNEDDYEGIIIIQKGTLLGYSDFNDEVTITGDYQGEEFEFISYVEEDSIYLRVSNPLSGTNFRLLEYVTLDEAYIPDTIARKSDLENIGGGGSVDSEEITEIKTTLDSHNELIEDLQNMKIDKENDDYYPNMSVGVADNLSGVDVVASEFTSRQSGGGAILDGTARIEAIKGNSIVWNQLLDVNNFGTKTANGITATASGDGSIVVSGSTTDNESWIVIGSIYKTIGNKYLLTGCPSGGSGNTYSLMDGSGSVKGLVDNGDGVIAECTLVEGAGKLATIQIVVRRNVSIDNLVFTPRLYDLTKMFGAGNEPTTVDEFYVRMPIEVNPMVYNEGQMVHLNPSGIWSYSADEEPIERFQDLSLIGALFPDGMKSVGEFHDEIRYNKETQKWEKTTRIGEVDLGSLNWSYSSSLGYFYSSPSEDIGSGNTFKDTNKQDVLINSVDFTGLHWSAFTNNYVSPRNNAISLFYTPDWDEVRANICCAAYTDVESFKKYLQGKKAYFVLNDPVVEELDFYGNLDYQVWNGGTEEIVPYENEPTTPLKADIAYGFNAYGKIKEHDEKLSNLETILDSKQDVLESSVNIKTINHQSILGEGNINIIKGISSLTLDSRNEEPTSEEMTDDGYKLYYSVEKTEAMLNMSISDALSAMMGGEELLLIIGLTDDDIGYFRPVSQICKEHESILNYEINIKSIEEHSLYTIAINNTGCEIHLSSIESGGGGECATPDWSAPEGEQGHILNRPCYFELSEMNILETEVMVGSSYQTTMHGGDLFRFKVLGETFDIDLSGKEIPTYDYDHEIQNKLSYTFDIDTIRVSVYFYDAGDGALTMEFTSAVNEGESAPDELTLYVAEYVVNGRQRLSEGLIPQTIARKSELTELSAEVGKKVDADFVNKAIAESLGIIINGDY